MHRSAVPIRRPCPRTWDQIDGEGATRLCTACGSAVTDLSALEEQAAQAHIQANPKSCVRYVADPRTGRIRHRAAGVAAAVATAMPGVAHASAHLNAEASERMWSRFEWAWEGLSAWVAPPPPPPAPQRRRPRREPPSDDERQQLELLGYFDPSAELPDPEVTTPPRAKMHGTRVRRSTARERRSRRRAPRAGRSGGTRTASRCG